MAQEPLVDQSFLEKLERLTLHWQSSFRGAVGGRIPSRFSGPGQEFLDHRHFRHGDDVRAVNWRAYLRLEKLFLKLFQIEPRIPVRLLFDCSESMEPKFEYARKLAAALCYVGLVRLDTICIQPFSEQLTDPLICAGGRHRFLPAVSFLERLRPGGKTDFLQTARQFIAAHPQRGLLIIFSDFMQEDPDIGKPLQVLSDFGHELLLVQLWTPEERSPSYEGEFELVNTETGQALEITLNEEACQAYTENFDRFSGRLQDTAQRSGGRYVGLSTATPLEEAIFGSMMLAGGVQ